MQDDHTARGSWDSPCQASGTRKRQDGWDTSWMKAPSEPGVVHLLWQRPAPCGEVGILWVTGGLAVPPCASFLCPWVPSLTPMTLHASQGGQDTRKSKQPREDT